MFTLGCSAEDSRGVRRFVFYESLFCQHPRTEEPRLTDPRGEFQWLKNDLAIEDERLERQYEELTRTQETVSAERVASSLE